MDRLAQLTVDSLKLEVARRLLTQALENRTWKLDRRGEPSGESDPFSLEIINFLKT